MVTGRIATYDPARGLYALPAEHAACLSAAARAISRSMPRPSP
jgi:hypothetical protein